MSLFAAVWQCIRASCAKHFIKYRFLAFQVLNHTAHGMDQAGTRCGVSLGEFWLKEHKPRCFFNPGAPNNSRASCHHGEMPFDGALVNTLPPTSQRLQTLTPVPNADRVFRMSESCGNDDGFGEFGGGWRSGGRYFISPDKRTDQVITNTALQPGATLTDGCSDDCEWGCASEVCDCGNLYIDRAWSRTTLDPAKNQRPAYYLSTLCDVPYTPRCANGSTCRSCGVCYAWDPTNGERPCGEPTGGQIRAADDYGLIRS
eukprot:gene5670-4131_t